MNFLLFLLSNTLLLFLVVVFASLIGMLSINFERDIKYDNFFFSYESRNGRQVFSFVSPNSINEKFFLWLVYVHELSHYFIARMLRVNVDEFYISSEGGFIGICCKNNLKIRVIALAPLLLSVLCLSGVYGVFLLSGGVLFSPAASVLLFLVFAALRPGGDDLSVISSKLDESVVDCEIPDNYRRVNIEKVFRPFSKDFFA